MYIMASALLHVHTAHISRVNLNRQIKIPVIICSSVQFSSEMTGHLYPNICCGKEILISNIPSVYHSLINMVTLHY